jgi:pSer/pThr/pTyr-binding forkhead associated (FHA) protein/tetratricopeptide (TPR) repeat protein
MKLIIEDDEGLKTVVPIARDEITIGRQEGNTIRLTERNVSRRHARLLKENGNLLIEDLGSYNGVRVNGEKITEKTKIKEGDLVEIGDYDLGIQGKLDPAMASAPASTAKQTTLPPGMMKTAAAAKPGAAAAAATQPPATNPSLPPVAPQPSAPAAPPPQAPAFDAAGATAIIRVSDIMKSAPQVEVHDLERAEMPRLVGLAGPFRGKEFYLMRTEVKFGRTDENDVVMDHQSVSRQHARFVLDQGQWKVIDNKSANGVRVNGDEYAVSNVNPGDTLELGHLKFRFCGPGEKFTPPAEKAEGEQKGGLKLTTAELIAGASQPGRTPVGKGGKPALPVGLIAGIGGAALVALAVVIFLLTRGPKPDEQGEVAPGAKLSAAEAIKVGDAAFKKHEYLKANEVYEQAIAQGATPPNRKRAADEARGEEIYQQLKAALEDGDKAKLLYEKCSTESTYFCQKAQEMADQVKAVYARKHLGSANAAKAAGKMNVCMNEVNLVLGFDAANADAQALGSQCAPKEVAASEEHKGPTAAERNAKANKLAKDAVEKVRTREFDAAISKAQAALRENPTDKTVLGQAYMALGYAYANKGDKANAVKWLEKYLPHCTASCDQVRQFIAN